MGDSVHVLLEKIGIAHSSEHIRLIHARREIEQLRTRLKSAQELLRRVDKTGLPYPYGEELQDDIRAWLAEDREE